MGLEESPERTAAWEKAEAPLIQRAEAQRRERLISWKRDRRPNPGEGDRITPWLDRELAGPADPTARTKSYLMVVKIGRTDVKVIDRKLRKAQRMLRLGWLSEPPGPGDDAPG